MTNLENLKRALCDQDRRWAGYTDPEQIENLIYAYHAVKPWTFTETALVVWAGSQFQSAAPIIDEYCRRRRKEPPQLFDHPVLALTDWRQPQTRRILVFREQLERLALELTGRDIARDIYQSVVAGREYNFEKFCKQLRPTYKDVLSGEEKKELYRYLQTMYGPARHYSWCASLVEQALTGKVEFYYEEDDS